MLTGRGKNNRTVIPPWLTGLLVVLVITLLPLFVAQVSAEEAIGRQGEKNSWRIVEDAPYRVIPAHPPLVEKGESSVELGIASFDDVLGLVEKRSRSYSVAFSPDGRFIASGCRDHTVKLWDITHRSVIAILKGHARPVSSVAFSPDGRFITSGSKDNTVRLWDVKDRATIAVFKGHTDDVNSVAFSPDGRFITSGSKDNTVRLWDVKDRAMIAVFEEHTDGVLSVAFSPDGRFLASGSEDNSVKLWDVKDRVIIADFEGHTSKVTSVAFNPDGRFLASGSADKTVKLWDVKERKMVAVLEGHTGRIFSIAFSPDGRFLASGTRSWDRTLTLWDIKARAIIAVLEERTGTVYSVAFSPDGRFLASNSGDSTVKLWDVKDRTMITVLEGHTGTVYSVAFSPDGRFLASGFWDDTVLLWDIKNRVMNAILEGITGNVHSVAFSPDGRFLASGSMDDTQTLTLWDVKGWTIIAVFDGGLIGTVYSVAFTSDSRFLASGSADKTVKLWDVQERKMIAVFAGHTDYVKSVAFSPDGRFLASGSNDNTVRLWNVKDRAIIAVFEGHTDSVRSVAFSPDGRFLASGSYDNKVKIWDVQERAIIAVFAGHTDSVRSVAFSPDGRFLASGSLDGTVRLWDVKDRAMIAVFYGHTKSVTSVAFSPNGRFVASGSGDGSVKRWDLKTKKLSTTWLAGQNGNWLSLDNDNQLQRGDDGTFLLNQDSDKQWQPIPISKISNQDDLSMTIASKLVPIHPGINQEIEIQVTNNGKQPAYWLHLKPTLSKDNTLRLDPPNRLLTGKGKQEWHPARIAKLEGGETASIFARISTNLPLPADMVQPGIRQLEITLSSANGTEISKTVSVDLQSPYLQWQKGRLEKDGKTLKATLQNSGNRELRDFTVYTHLQADNDHTKNSLEDEPVKQKIASLKPGESRELSFILPEPEKGAKITQQTLTLQGSNRKLPIYTWNLSALEFEKAGRWLVWLLLLLLLLTTIAIFYLKRYRHPLLVKLSTEPVALRRLPIEQLTEALKRLDQAGRLAKILSEAEVTAKTMTNSLTFTENSAARKAQWLADRLGATINPADNGLWEMRLNKEFPLNMDRCLLAIPEPGIEPADFLAAIKHIPETRNQPTLLIGANSEYQRQLFAKTRDRSNKLVAPQGTEVTELLLSPTPETVLAKIFANQLILSQISPYQIGGGVNRESMFFGRREIISHIMNRDPANYLVVSGRQLGKSSLLKALHRRYQDFPEVTAHYLSLSSEQLIPRLASKLKLDRSAGLDAVSQYIGDSGRSFVFLIDEADIFIKHEKAYEYRILNLLRQLSEENCCSFILAGFWHLYEHAVLDNLSPLKNFGEIIQLDTLEPDACRQLVTEPMESMGVRYEDDRMVEQLFTATGRRSNLLAIACYQIIEQLRGDQRVIGKGDVQQALNCDRIVNALKGWDAMTDDAQACRLDRIIVWATIGMDRFDFAELMGLLDAQGIQAETSEIQGSLDRLELGFVLGKDEGRYYYRIPLFKKMILEDSPEAKIRNEVGVYQRGV